MISPSWPPGRVKGTGRFVRWLLLDRLPAGVTEAILPTIPALEDDVTAQAGGQPRIHGADDFSSSVCPWSTRGLFTHDVLSDTGLIGMGQTWALIFMAASS
jgi:hypothetical protein